MAKVKSKRPKSAAATAKANGGSARPGKQAASLPAGINGKRPELKEGDMWRVKVDGEMRDAKIRPHTGDKSQQYWLTIATRKAGGRAFGKPYPVSKRQFWSMVDAAQ